MEQAPIPAETFVLGFWDIMLIFGGIFLLIAIIFTVVAQVKVSSTFKKYSSVLNNAGCSGMEAAQMVLHQNGIYDVRIEPCQGHLTDHYDPRCNTIFLSESVFSVSTPAAVGVAAHEAGHAVQYAKNYFPVKLRTAIIPAASIMSRFATPLLLIGILLGMTGFLWLGIIAFSASVLFELVTLPCEFNASRRATKAIAFSGRFSKNDEVAAKKVLTAAAMTYVAALAVSLIYLLRYIAIAVARSRDR